VVPSAAGLQAVQWVVATTTAYLVARHAPFARWLRVLVVFGYFPLFEYGVLSRGYSVGVLLVVVTLVLAGRRPRSWAALGCTLALLALTSLSGVVLAVALGAGLACDRRRDDRWRAGDPRARIGALTLAGGSLLALVPMRPPPDGLYAAWRTGYDGDTLRTLLAAPWNALAPLPDGGAHWWNTNVLDRAPVLTMVLGVAAFVVVAVALRASRSGLTVWLVAVPATIGLAYLRDLPMELRHEGAVYVAFLAAVWLAAADGPARSRLLMVVVTVVVGVQAVAGLLAFGAAATSDFTGAAAAARWIAATDREAPSILVGDNAALVSPVAYRLDRPVVIPEDPSGHPFVRWRRDLQPQAATDGPEQLAALRTARRLAAAGDQPVLLVTTAPLPPSSGARLLRRVPPGIVPDERYWIYAP
jgi:hypothetical protein